MTTEKAINIVRKLLATANDNGASENEAMTAALRAQEIMAKYDINISNIEEQIDEEIVSSSVVIGNGNKWKFMLANIVSTNFCCKVYTVNSSTIVFHGYKRHADVAKSVFEFLFETGVKLAKKNMLGSVKRKVFQTKEFTTIFLQSTVPELKLFWRNNAQHWH